jgi:peptidoglycan/xylan/chitin deacetylase (PgdA/CDA1 family)
MFRSPSPVHLAEHERVLAGLRPGYRVPRSRSLAKLLAKSVLGMPAAAVRNWRRKLHGSHPVRILFHHVVADRPHRMGISTDEFYRHVQFLRRHYRIVSLADALEVLKTGKVSEPTVVLTFDDGYRDNFLTLRAIVEETGVPITLFVSSEHMTTGREFAHDVRANEPGFAPLTWEELAQMQREGFEIGSHTRTHFDCGSRERGRLSGEILGSKRELQQRLRVPIDLFSFPGGLPANMSPEAMALAAQGYRCVLSAFGGTNEPGQDLRHLKRWFHASHRWELELQLQGVLEREPAFTWQPDAAPAAAPTLGDAVASARGA